MILGFIFEILGSKAVFEKHISNVVMIKIVFDANSILSVFNALGITSIITYIVFSYINARQEFVRLKRVIGMELSANLLLLEDLRRRASEHAYPMPILNDAGWHALLSSPQLRKFYRGDKPSDLMILLSAIYTRIGSVNQTIRIRDQIPFSAFRAMGETYEKTIKSIDDYLAEEATKLISIIEKALKMLEKA